MQSRNTILTFGFAALGALAAAVFLAQHSPDAFTIILVLGVLFGLLVVVIAAVGVSSSP